MSAPNSDSIISLEDGWNKEIKSKALVPLEDMIENGLNEDKKLFDNRSYSRIYTTCYNMCTQRPPYNWSEQLYQRHGETIASYLSDKVLPSLQKQHDDFLLVALVRRGDNHMLMNRWLMKFFMYLDRYYVKYNDLATLENAGLAHFKNLVFDNVKQDSTRAVLRLIDQERDGQAVDRQMISNVVKLFNSMGMGSARVYEDDFEIDLLASSREYYARKAGSWLESDSTPAYLDKAERCLDDESSRVTSYLNPETEAKLLHVVEEEILDKHKRELLEKEGSGCKALLLNDMEADLQRMFRLFQRIREGLDPMADIFKSHIISIGTEVMQARTTRLSTRKERETNEDAQYIRDLLSCHDKYMSLVAKCFDRNALFQKALKEAFQEIINSDSGKFKTSDLLSSFCDRILKTGSNEKLSETEIEDTLDKTVQLFSYLHDKDVFAEIYRNQLSKRLLNQRSASDEMERQMIGKLKIKCGAQFTAKMEGMLNDLSIGLEHAAVFDKHFKERQGDLGVGKMEFNVHVLTTGHWPNHKVYDAVLPGSMSRCMQTFKEFYTETNNKRRLEWYYGLGNASIRGTFGKKSYDLQVATLQAIVLMEFNDESVDFLPFQTIVTKTGLKDEVLKRVLHSLSCAKYRVLRLENVGGEKKEKALIASTDRFRFNTHFTCQMRKIRLPMASLEDSHNPKRVEEDRTIAIEACIVRVMKARKTLGHQQLVAEVLNQLAFFRPDPKVIKKRIESLIDRDFLERDGTAGIYKYLA